MNMITVIDDVLTDPKGQMYSVWSIYFEGRVIAVEYTRNNSLAVDRVEFPEAA